MNLPLLCILLCAGICRSFTSAKVLPQSNDDNHWSYLLLAQFWPESSCIYFKEKGDECYIPPGIKGWTIHGLWPSRPDSTEYPHDCNSSMPFDMHKIEALRPQLDQQWHYYNKDGDPTYLWNHEWTKHGTCGFSLSDIRGEYKFFNKTLDLHRQYNLTAALEKSDITPSRTDTYKREDFFNAVLKYYNVKPYVVCDWDSQEEKAYIDQIYLCFNKTFHLQNCYPTRSRTEADSEPSYYQGCEERDNIIYLPYNDNFHKESRKKKDQSLIFKSEVSIVEIEIDE